MSEPATFLLLGLGLFAAGLATGRRPRVILRHVAADIAGGLVLGPLPVLGRNYMRLSIADNTDSNIFRRPKGI